MTDTSQQLPKSRLDEVGKTVAKYVAIITALISVAVPLTEWLRGISNQRIKEIEQRSDLASKYLDRIANKEPNNPDRIMYLTALSALDDHPLQSWAKEQLAKQRKLTEELNAIYDRAHKAIEASRGKQAQLEELNGRIEVLKYKMGRAERPDEMEPLNNQFTVLMAERSTLLISLKDETKEASSAAAQIVAKGDNQAASTGLLSAIEDLKKAASASSTAKVLSLDNTPTGDAAAALNFVLESIAQPVERHFGKRVEIVSGYRSPSVNAAVGGPPQGSHALGEAIDIQLPGVTLLDLAIWIRDNLVFDQLILERDVVHVSAKRNRAENRLQVLRQTGGPGSPAVSGLTP